MSHGWNFRFFQENTIDNKGYFQPTPRVPNMGAKDQKNFLLIQSLFDLKEYKKASFIAKQNL